MIHKLYKLIEYIKPEYIPDNPLKLNISYKEGDIIFINLKKDKEDAPFVFINCELEKYDYGKNRSHYLFEELDAPNSTPTFPTYRVNKAGNKSPAAKVEGALKRIIKCLNSIPELKKAGETVLKETAIQEDILEKMNFKESFIVSVKINGKYPGKSTLLKKTIKKRKAELFSPYYTFKNKEYKIKNKVCNLCKNQKEEVWGYVSTYNFYAVKTELAPLAGGFNAAEAWKNYPVCPECAFKLDKGRAFLDSNLTFNFCGLRYYLLPEFIGSNTKDNQEIIDIITGEGHGALSLEETKRKRLTDAENEIFEQLAESGNYANYTLFFYEINNAEFKILLSIDDVYPSRFKRIFDAKEKAENPDVNTFFKHLKGKDNYFDLEFKFNLIRYYFPDSKIEGNFTAHFLSILRSVFMNKKIDYQFMLHRIMEKNRTKFINDENTFYSTLYAIMIFKFIYQLQLFNNISESTERKVTMENKYEEFFLKHPEFFTTNTKKAVFLTGVLCQMLLDIQYNSRNAKPFRSRLNSLKLNEKIFKRLVVEIQEKLEQYDKNYYKNMEEQISRYILDSKFELSNDEISFYFLMGMNLAGEFKSKKENEEEANVK